MLILAFGGSGLRLPSGLGASTSAKQGLKEVTLVAAKFTIGKAATIPIGWGAKVLPAFPIATHLIVGCTLLGVF
jgi:hypothetical protein